MLLSDFSIAKGKFAGTELPVVEGESHSYKTSRYPRKKGYGSNEKKRHSQRSSTATHYPRESFDSDNSMLRASGDLHLDIDPYLKHYNESGWQVRPGGKGWHSSEKNDDRRTRMGWVQDLEYKKWREKNRRNALKAVKRALWYNRVDPMTHSHGDAYKKLSGAPYGPGEG